MSDQFNDFALAMGDPTAPVRALQSEITRRRSALMEKVRKVYALTPRDTLLQNAFDELLEDLAERRDGRSAHGASNRNECNLLVVIGESGAGKTTAVRRMLDKHALQNGYDVNAPGCQIAMVTAPLTCNLAELGRETLRTLGLPTLRKRVDGPEVWRRCRERIRDLGILVIHFDEMQHVVQTVNEVEIQKVRNVVKGLLVDDKHPVALIISGTPATVRLLEADRQVARRGRWIELSTLNPSTDSKMVAKFTAKLAEEAELCIAVEEAMAVAPRIIHAGLRQLGVVAEEIHNAIRVALRCGDSHLRCQHFGEAFANRTGNLTPFNPYLAENWRAVDAGRVLATDAPATRLPKGTKGGPR